MTSMEKFYELFRRDLKTPRLELRVLKPTPENAKLVWNAIKDENPADFKYVNWTPGYKKPLPESLDETLVQMQKEEQHDVTPNGAVWYVFHNGKLIGHHGVFYFDNNKSIQSGNVWFVKSAQKQGFNQEIWSLLMKMAFEQLGANRIMRQCMANNEQSQKSIMASGFHLDGRIRASTQMPDGSYMDQLVFTKLLCEYNGKQ
ncbi:MAG: GNAT family N-acetyltransferase [Alphaproteobacteria bacterium]|nr:GNAT family N-acetyltransferase [Alphaproteobacteria bacterium]